MKIGKTWIKNERAREKVRRQYGIRKERNPYCRRKLWGIDKEYEFRKQDRLYDPNCGLYFRVVTVKERYIRIRNEGKTFYSQTSKRQARKHLLLAPKCKCMVCEQEEKDAAVFLICQECKEKINESSNS